jgi:hypothetical protein
MKFRNLNNLFKSISLPLNNQKGMALMATLIFTFVISTMGIALLTMTNNETKLSALQKDSTDAFYLADSGTERAISWMEKQGAPPSSIPPPLDGSADIAGMGGGYYSVTIDPPSSGTEVFNKIYTITCVGHAGYSNSKRTIETKIRVLSFAGFAYFSDEEKSAGEDTIWFRTDDLIGGKMHSNDLIHVSGTPHFLGEVSTAFDHIDYMNNSYYTRLVEGEMEIYNPNFEDIFQSEETEWGLTLSDEVIPLPQNRAISGTEYARSLENISLGPSYHSTDVEDKKVYIPRSGNNVNGGIYVKGDVEELILGTDTKPGGNSKISIKQNIGSYYSPNYNVTEIITDEVFRSTQVTKYDNSGNVIAGYPISYNGISNGVLFIGGSVNDLQGDKYDGGLQGKLTIAASGNITIGGDILYSDRIDNDIDFSSEDADLSLVNDSLGLVSEHNIIVEKNATGSHNDPHDSDNIEIDAILMAINTSFTYEDYTDLMKGTLKVFGAFIQERRGAVGTFYSGSDSKASGFTKDYHYDQRMASTDPEIPSMTPPYFPTTGNYEKISWREIR